MNTVSLTDLARAQLLAAEKSSASRASVTVVGGHDHAMRQTVVALSAGQELSEHENPGQATVYVLTGRVELRAGEEVAQLAVGELAEVPPARHTLRALEDSAVLLTAVPRAHID
jgi:quercetin dioxygenase-like cupin family protein